MLGSYLERLKGERGVNFRNIRNGTKSSAALREGRSRRVTMRIWIYGWCLRNGGGSPTDEAEDDLY